MIISMSIFLHSDELDYLMISRKACLWLISPGILYSVRLKAVARLRHLPHCHFRHRHQYLHCHRHRFFIFYISTCTNLQPTEQWWRRSGNPNCSRTSCSYSGCSCTSCSHPLTARAVVAADAVAADADAADADVADADAGPAVPIPTYE